MFDVFINNRKMCCGVSRRIAIKAIEEQPKQYSIAVYRHNTLKQISLNALANNFF